MQQNIKLGNKSG